MAKLKNQFLGKVSGKLGDIVFRNTRKTNYLSSRPSSFNVPMDEDAINRRGKFAISGKLSSILISVPELKQIWLQQIPSDANIHNYLVKTFYPLLDGNGLNENISITPPMGFIAQPNQIEVTTEMINVTIKAISNRSGINPEVEKSVKLFSIVSLDSPSVKNLMQYTLIPLNSENVALSLDNDLLFTIPLTNQISNLMDKYTNRLMLFCLVTFDMDNNPINYSATFYRR